MVHFYFCYCSVSPSIIPTPKCSAFVTCSMSLVHVWYCSWTTCHGLTKAGNCTDYLYSSQNQHTTFCQNGKEKLSTGNCTLKWMVGLSSYADKAGKDREIHFSSKKCIQQIPDSVTGNCVKDKDWSEKTCSIKCSSMSIGNSSMNRHPFKSNPDGKGNAAHL